eukprot:7662141-Heterocapsa_arctica.AAC.1
MAADLRQAPQRHTAERPGQSHLLHGRVVHVPDDHVQHSSDRIVQQPPDFAQRPSRAQTCV